MLRTSIDFFLNFGHSFLKNGILEYWSETLIVSILICSSNDNQVYEYDFYVNRDYEFSSLGLSKSDSVRV